MALIAAVTINIDWAMFATALMAIALIVIFIVAPLILLFVLARAKIRRICGNDPIDINAPRVRTRIHQKPIDKEIADFLRSEYPNRKPAQFI